MRTPLAIALLAVAVAVGACGGAELSADAGPPSFPSAPLTTLASDSGKLTLEVRSDPQPLARGVDAVQVTVTDASGAAVDGLDLAVLPWMPVMGHGSATTPSVLARGQGVYEVTDVYLAMPGTWQLRITISGAMTDSATPSFQIP